MGGGRKPGAEARAERKEQFDRENELFGRTITPRPDPKFLRGEYVAAGSVLIGILMIYLLPGLGGQRFTWWGQVVELTSRLIPSIDRLAAATSFQDSCRQALVFLWLSFPIQVWCWLRSVTIFPDYAKAHRIWMVLGLLMSVVMVWGIGWDLEVSPTNLDGDHWIDWFFIVATSWRIGMALIGGTAIASAACLFGVGIRLTFCAFKPK